MNQYYIDKLPPDIYNILKEEAIIYLSALKIQKQAYKMFYNKYGLFSSSLAFPLKILKPVFEYL